MKRQSSVRDRLHRLGTLGVAFWLIFAVLILASLFFEVRRPHWLLTAYAFATVGCSVVAFTLYGTDKRRARKGRRRISERTLHGISLCGGWPGAFFAQRVFRHKTQKLPFRIVFFLTVTMHVSVVAYAVWATFFAPESS